MPPEKNNHVLLIIGTIVIVLIIGVVYLYIMKSKVPANIQTVVSKETSSAIATSTATSLGSDIYNKAKNPIDNKIPTQKTTVNPINDAYTNPFK